MNEAANGIIYERSTMYAVFSGKEGNKIYNTWGECKKNTSGVKGAKFHKFDLEKDCINFINNCKEVSEEKFCEGDEIHYPCAWVDGSVIVNGSNYYVGYGFVIFDREDHEISRDFGRCYNFLDSRNIIGEITASINALKTAVSLGMKEIWIYHDYNGLCHFAIGDWTPEIDAAKWYKREFDSITKKSCLKVNFVKVKSHTGVKYNELADRLAKEGAKDSK